MTVITTATSRRRLARSARRTSWRSNLRLAVCRRCSLVGTGYPPDLTKSLGSGQSMGTPGKDCVEVGGLTETDVTTERKCGVTARHQGWQAYYLVSSRET